MRLLFPKLSSNLTSMLAAAIFIDAGFIAAQVAWDLKAETVMTPQELKDTGGQPLP